MRYRVIAVCLALALTLSGCQLIRNVYYNSVPHANSYNQSAKEEETVTVSSYTELKNAILSFIEDGVQEAAVTAGNYSGDLEKDYARAVSYATKTNPLGSYLVESISHRTVGVEPYYRLDLLICYRRTLEDLRLAQPMRTDENVRIAVCRALEKNEKRLLLEYSGYTELDYAAIAEDYYRDHVTKVMVLPHISAEVFPQSGSIRYVELTLDYSYSDSELEFMQTTVDALIESASSSVRNIGPDMAKANALYSFLSEHRTFSEGSFNARAYALLWQGTGDSLAFASVFKAMCEKAGINCKMVYGTKDEEEYYWNILEFEDGCWHVDLYADNHSGQTYLQFLTDSQMDGYSWEGDYPACLGAPTAPAAGEAPAPAAPSEPQPVEEPPAEPEPEPEPEQVPEEIVEEDNISA